jgi:hypothetical protein
LEDDTLPNDDAFHPALRNAADRSTQEITDILNDLFQWPPASHRYAGNFLLLPAPQTPEKIKEDMAGPVLANPPGVVSPFYPYTLNDFNVHMRVVRPSSIVDLPIFANHPPNDPSDAIFVVLDGFGSAVPISVANLMEANFTNGLVTRLVLGELVREWQSYPHGSVLTADKLSFGDPPFTALIGDAFVNTASYQPGETFGDAVQSILEKNPVLPAGILWGWQAGDELDALTGGDLKFRTDVWKLITSRYSLSDIGEMTGFTLNYIIAFANNARIVSITDNSPMLGDADILRQLALDDTMITYKKMLSDFNQVLIASFYAISRNSSLHNENDKGKLLSAYYSFMTGYSKGNIKSSDVIYDDVFTLGFGIGYKEGFRDGYSSGYAAGYKDGFASGYKAAWDAARQMIDDLNRQVSTLTNQTGNSGGFLDTLGTIGNVVETAVGVIGAIFG